MPTSNRLRKELVIPPSLPQPVCYWSIDQIAFMLHVSYNTLYRNYIYKCGVDQLPKKGEELYEKSLKINAVNISPGRQKARWMVPHEELMRWHKLCLYIIKELYDGKYSAKNRDPRLLQGNK